jgi:hypothetical protein
MIPKMPQTILRAASLAICIALLTTSCSQGPKKMILGKWKSASGEAIEFFPDGTVSASGNFANYAGTFSFPDNKHIKLELGGLIAIAGPLVANYSLSSNELRLTEQGTETIYKRIR